jgi:purine-cytosine permease-like protein
MTLLALIGFEAVKKATKLFIPILVIGQGIILYLFLTKGADSLTTLTQGQEPFSIGTFLFYSSLVFVQYISGVSASSDITRYSKSDRHGFWGLYSGNVVGFMMTALLGGLSASLFKDLNPFVAAGQLTDSSLLLLVITACAMVSMISINLSNAYTGGYSLLNALPSLSRIQSALLFSVAGIILSSFPQLVYNAQEYISYLGILIIPISAIVVADYLVIRKGRISENALVRLANGESNFNREALYVLAIGMVFYFVIPDSFSPGFSCFILTSIIYVFSKKISKVEEQKPVQKLG